MDTRATTEGTPPAGDKPERLIRTFAGDMDVLKQGGAPDLTPLAPSHRAPQERLVAASPLPPSPAPAAPPPEIPDVEPIPPPALAPAAPLPPVASLQTYANDFRERLEETHASTATVLAAEQDSAPVRALPQQQPKSSSNLLYIVTGVVLLVAGAAGAYIAYSRYVTARAPVVSAPSVAAPIFVDDREEISGSGNALLSAVEKSVARTLAPNTVRLLYLASTTTGSVFSLLPLAAPDIVLRNVDPSGSMAGVANMTSTQDQTQSPFFILSVGSYRDTFAGMLSWEPAMPRDLTRLFPPHPSGAVSTTTQSATTTPAVRPGFRDETILNHDVRIYRDAAGRSLMIYGYWNQTTLIIARDSAVFTELVQRLATSRAQN